MLPLDQHIKYYGSLQSYAKLNYNYPSNFRYSSNSYPWNMDFQNVKSNHYFPQSNYLFKANPEFQEVNEVKQVSQLTHPSQISQPLQSNKKQSLDMLEKKANDGKPSQTKNKQKYGRNIVSNIFHMALKKMISAEFTKTMQKAISANKMSINAGQFIQRLEEKTQNIKRNVNVKVIKSVMVGRPIRATKLDLQFRRLLRILCRIYNHNYHLPHLYHTRKIKKESRRLHLRHLRHLRKFTMGHQK